MTPKEFGKKLNKIIQEYRDYGEWQMHEPIDTLCQQALREAGFGKYIDFIEALDFYWE